MLVHVLGSAAGGGFPQWNCNCANCSGVRAGSIRARPRTQSSLALSDGGGRWLLVNASPDVRAQIAACPVLQPGTPVRATGIAAVLLMDAQIDHVTGLLSLREGRALTVLCSDPVRQDLSAGLPLFPVLGHYLDLNVVPLPDHGTPFVVAGIPRVTLRTVALASKAPPYSPHRHDPHPGDNLGLVAEDAVSGRRLFYAPGLGAVDGAVAHELEQADIALIDGTCWHDDELARAGVPRPKRAREMGHLPLAGAGGMLEQLARFPRPRKILIHINNTNPILDEDSPERRELERLGVEVAEDGMELAL